MKDFLYCLGKKFCLLPLIFFLYLYPASSDTILVYGNVFVTEIALSNIIFSTKIVLFIHSQNANPFNIGKNMAVSCNKY